MMQRHNTELADILGNLVHRATNLCVKYDGGKVVDCDSDIVFDLDELIDDVEGAFAEFRIHDAAEHVLEAVRTLNKYIQDKAPWGMKNDEVGRTKVVQTTIQCVYVLAHFMYPFIPASMDLIFERLSTPVQTIKTLSPSFNNLAVGTDVTVGCILFTKFEKDGAK